MYRAGMKLATAVLALGTAWGQTSTPAPPASPASPAQPAVPAAPATPKAPRAKAYRVTSSSRPYLGVDTRNVTPERAAALKLKGPGGVEVTMVDQDAPAGKAGLREHDVIQTFNGQKVDNHEELARMIRDLRPGAKVSLGIVRDGQPHTLTATLGSRQTFESNSFSGPDGKRMRIVVPDVHIPPLPPMDFDVPQIAVMQYWSRNGAMVEDLTPQLAQYFGVKNGSGVLVRSVEKGSAAEAAGLKAGDIIVRVNGESVGCSTDWRQAMREKKSGTVSLGIVRDKREQTLSLKLPERSSNAWPSSPDFDRQMEQMRRELDRIGPQIDRANELAQRDVERAMEDLQRQMERTHAEQERAFERRQAEAERARERTQREVERKLEQQQKKLEQQQQQQTPK